MINILTPLTLFTTILLFISYLSLSKSSNQTINNMPAKRNLTSPLSLSTPAAVPKKLRRVPHVFSKVLELPFHLNADVSIEDRREWLRFEVEDGEGIISGGGVLAHVVEVHPGITKVVIRRRENVSLPLVDELGFDVWRYRLPETARAELAKAVYGGGRLVVTVPKIGWGERIQRDGEDSKGGFRGNMGNIFLVY